VTVWRNGGSNISMKLAAPSSPLFISDNGMAHEKKAQRAYMAGYAPSTGYVNIIIIIIVASKA